MAEFRVKLWVLGLVVSSALSGAPINLIQNSSFEDNTIAPGVNQTNTYLNGGAWQVFTAIDRWGLGYPTYGIELQRNNLYGVPSNAPSGNNAWDGLQFAELDYRLGLFGIGQTATPQVFQDISTVQGATYLLSFYYSPRPDAGQQQLGVFWGATSAPMPALVQSTLVGQGTSALTWSRYDFSLVATSTSMRIGFGSLQNRIDLSYSGGNLLDLVSLTIDPNSIVSGNTTTAGTTAAGTTAAGTTAAGTTAAGTTAAGTTTGTTTGTTAGDPPPDPGIPEPSTYAMLGTGLIAAYLLRKSRS